MIPAKKKALSLLQVALRVKTPFWGMVPMKVKVPTKYGPNGTFPPVRTN
jgi:hypothetical protein